MITITIRTDNAAFQDGNRASEVARIVRDAADRIVNRRALWLLDSNGNRVGRVVLTGKDREL